MGRFLAVSLVVLGIGYGGWSLFRSDHAGKALSAKSGSTANSKAVRKVGGAAPGTEVPPAETASSSSEPDEKTGPTAGPGRADVSALVAQADAKLAGARTAKTRRSALMAMDTGRRLLSRAFFATTDPRKADQLRSRLDALNRKVIFSEVCLDGKAFPHRFGARDRLWTLCYKVWPREKDVHIEPGFLLWVNGLSDARKIREGQVIKVPTEKLSLLVSKSRFRLWVLLGGVYVKEFVVGLGVDDKTPEGEFVIDTKIKDPDWYSNGHRIRFGDPRDPLGTRWMGFKRTRVATGYGIHGTSDPTSVGKDVSQGCVRMKDQDVELLFSWVARGTKVRIVR